MLSLPLIPPQPDLHHTQYRPRPDSPPPASRTNNHHDHPHRPNSNKSKSSSSNEPSALALLNAAEASIAQRKQTIRNFGSQWLRPPGVAKTLQAMREEADELAEQEEAARQEQGLRDLQARHMVEEAAATRNAEADGEGEGDRDLDAEIPDADHAPDTSAVEDDVTFNDDSLVEGSHAQTRAHVQEEAELTGAARDEEALGISHEENSFHSERNLDDSIPEAGSYQHTDTEVEDDDSDSGSFTSQLSDPVAARARREYLALTGMPSSRRPRQGSGRGLRERIGAQAAVRVPRDAPVTPAAGGMGETGLTRSPAIVDLSSPFLGNDTSVLGGSSPVLQRRRGRGGAGRRGVGRGGRMS